MKIVKPSVSVFFHLPVDENFEKNWDPEVFLEKVGRTCYKSEDRITPRSASKFVSMLYDRGHHAMLEHCFASCHFVCDRGVSHELVRHRLVSYAQESTRYCNYGKDKFGNEISVIKPPEMDIASENNWIEAVSKSEEIYLSLIANGTSPQIARSVLPICLKTEIWASANLREWTHIFGLRCSVKAHPQIRYLMLQALEIFARRIPSMFKDLLAKYGE